MAALCAAMLLPWPGALALPASAPVPGCVVCGRALRSDSPLQRAFGVPTSSRCRVFAWVLQARAVAGPWSLPLPSFGVPPSGGAVSLWLLSLLQLAPVTCPCRPLLPEVVHQVQQVDDIHRAVAVEVAAGIVRRHRRCTSRRHRPCTAGPPRRSASRRRHRRRAGLARRRPCPRSATCPRLCQPPADHRGTAPRPPGRPAAARLRCRRRRGRPRRPAHRHCCPHRCTASRAAGAGRRNVSSAVPQMPSGPGLAEANSGSAEMLPLVPVGSVRPE